MCPSFRELNETVKLKCVNIDTVATSVGITHVLELCGLNSPKIILHAKSSTFRAAKLKGFTVISFRFLKKDHTFLSKLTNTRENSVFYWTEFNATPVSRPCEPHNDASSVCMSVTATETWLECGDLSPPQYSAWHPCLVAATPTACCLCR